MLQTSVPLLCDPDTTPLTPILRLTMTGSNKTPWIVSFRMKNGRKLGKVKLTGAEEEAKVQFPQKNRVKLSGDPYIRAWWTVDICCADQTIIKKATDFKEKKGKSRRKKIVHPRNEFQRAATAHSAATADYHLTSPEITFTFKVSHLNITMAKMRESA